MGKAKAFYSELSTATESVTVTYLLESLEREVGMLYSKEKGTLQVCFNWRLLAQEAKVR